MQVFIIGSPLETAMALDRARLNKQIIEVGQILDALNGKKAWSRHPAVLQYRGYEKWLEHYQRVLIYYNSLGVEHKFYNEMAIKFSPEWHCAEYYDQMKCRLYTKNPEHYKQWEHLGRSDCNWYWSQEDNKFIKFIKYINGKRV